jgi:hypothetical protein
MYKLDRCSLVTALLLVVNLALVWALPVLPCQDLPQHLSYATIFAKYNDSSLPFSSYFELPQRLQPYDSVYLLVAWLGRSATVMTALRILLSAYTVLTFAGLQSLVNALHRDGRSFRPAWTDVLATLLVWSPVMCMGFLSFALCVPPFLLACAHLLRWSGNHARPLDACVTLACTTAMSSVHVAAALAFGLFVFLYAACNWRPRPGGPRLAPLVATLVVLLAVLGVWQLSGSVVGEMVKPTDAVDAFREASGFDALNSIFRITWRDPLVTLTYACATILGPFSWSGQLVVASALVALWFGLRRIDARCEAPTETTSPDYRRFRRAVGAFALVSCLVPWGIRIPAELTYINLRLMSLAFALSLALVRPERFAANRAKVLIAGFCAVYLVHFGARAIAFQREALPALRLVARAEPGRSILGLAFHGHSAQFGKIFRVTHFLSLYYTVLEGGIDTQFWARYTPHLPIGYRPGKRPSQPPDWYPERFDQDVHLQDVDFVLLEQASDDDARQARASSDRARREIEDRCETIACEGRYCLYRVLNARAARNM